MKPIHIVVLVLAGAAGGAVLMKVVQHRVTEAPLLSQTLPAPPAAAPAISSAPPPAEPSASSPAPPSSAASAPSPAPTVTTVSVPEPPVQAKTEPRRRPAAPPKRMAIRKRSPLPPPPANPRPLVVAQSQIPPAAAPPTGASAAPADSTPAPLVVPPLVQESPMPKAPPAAPPENVTPPSPPPQPEPHSATLNAGMLIPVRLLDGLSSERNSPGDPFIATLDRELVADGFVIAERGARVEGRVVAVDRGSRAKGGASLTVELIRLHTSDRQIVPIQTDSFEKREQADRRTDAEKVGAGAAIGAIIGALAGGGKGAAVGAGAGGGVGVGDVLLTRKPATLPTETRITFRLRDSVRLTEKVGRANLPAAGIPAG